MITSTPVYNPNDTLQYRVLIPSGGCNPDTSVSRSIGTQNFAFSNKAKKGISTGITTTLQDKFKTHPNPSTGIVYVNESATIFDMSGRPIMSSENGVLNISNFSNGVYILSTATENLKIIKE